MPTNRYAITSEQGVITSPLLRTNIEPFQLTSRDALELAAWLVVMAETNASFYGDVDPDEKAIHDNAMHELFIIVEEMREPPKAPNTSAAMLDP